MLPPDTYFANPDFQRLEAAFHDYVAQGEGRNITWLVAKTGLPLKTVAQGFTQGFWLQRINSIGPTAAAATRDSLAAATGKLVGDVAGMNERDVARQMELEEKAHAKLMTMLDNNELKPDLLYKIAKDARESRRKMLGLGDEAPPPNPLQKLLDGLLVGENASAPKPFVLDQKTLEAPSELPAMPGMTSDADDPHRELDDDEKEQLRP